MNKELLNTGNILLSDLAETIADCNSLIVIGFPLFMDYSLPTENLFNSSFFHKLFDSIHSLPVTEEKFVASPENSSRRKPLPSTISPAKDCCTTFDDLTSSESESYFSKNAHAHPFEVHVPSSNTPPARNGSDRWAIYKTEQTESNSFADINREVPGCSDFACFNNQAYSTDEADLQSESKSTDYMDRGVQECSDYLHIDNNIETDNKASLHLAGTLSAKNSTRIKGFAEFANSFYPPREETTLLDLPADKSITTDKEISRKSTRQPFFFTHNKKDELNESFIASPPADMVSGNKLKGSLLSSPSIRSNPIIEKREDEANPPPKGFVPQAEAERLIRLIEKADAAQVEVIANMLRAAIEAKATSDLNYFIQAGTSTPDTVPASSTGAVHISTILQPTWDLTKHKEPEIPQIGPTANHENIRDSAHLLLKELRTDYQRLYGN